MDEYSNIDGTIITGWPTMRLDDMKSLFSSIEKGLNAFREDDDKIEAKPLDRCEGGIIMIGGKDGRFADDAEKIRKEVRFTKSVLGYDVAWPFIRNESDWGIKEAEKTEFKFFTRYKPEKRESKYYAPKTITLTFKCNSNANKWTYEEACLVEEEFRKVGFICSKTPKSGGKHSYKWRKSNKK